VNRLQNFPVLSSAAFPVSISAAIGDATVKGSLRSTPKKKFRIDLYSSPSADPSGHGEGQIWLGSRTIKTNDKGKKSFSVLVGQVSTGHVITATATRVSTGDTSEFSAAVPVTL
jgi:hypothetical protein